MGDQIHTPAVTEDDNLPANAIEAVFVIKMSKVCTLAQVRYW